MPSAKSAARDGQGDGAVDTFDPTAWILKRATAVDDDDLATIIPLNVQVCTIGRRPSNTIVLTSEKFRKLVSRRHAKLIWNAGVNGGSWSIVDLGSTNGVLVNHRKVTDAEIHDGDKISFVRAAGKAVGDVLYDKRSQFEYILTRSHGNANGDDAGGEEVGGAAGTGVVGSTTTMPRTPARAAAAAAAVSQPRGRADDDDSDDGATTPTATGARRGRAPRSPQPRTTASSSKRKLSASTSTGAAGAAAAALETTTTKDDETDGGSRAGKRTRMEDDTTADDEEEGWWFWAWLKWFGSQFS